MSWDVEKNKSVVVSRYDCLVKSIKALEPDPAICLALVKPPPSHGDKPVKNYLGVRLCISSLAVKGVAKSVSKVPTYSFSTGGKVNFINSALTLHEEYILPASTVTPGYFHLG
jgi:hypothetical protein